MAKKEKVGSSLDDLLKKEGIYDSCNNTAIKRVLAYQIEQLMKDRGLSKAAFAKQMGTSRSSLDRLLDPENDAVTLATLKKAAKVVNQRIEIRLIDAA